MRILIINSIYPTPNSPRVLGGAELFARMFAEKIASTGDQVEVIRAGLQQNQMIESCNDVIVRTADICNLYPPFIRRRSAPRRLLWHAIEDWGQTATFVLERIKAFQPDIVYSNTLAGLTTGVWRAAHSCGVPIVHTLHDYYLTCPRCTRFAKGGSCESTCLVCRLLTIQRRRATNRVNAVVGVSQRTLDIHTNLGLFRDTPIKRVIRNAAPPVEVVHMREGTDGPLVLGFIGRVSEEKGIEHLVKALDFLPAGLVTLKIAGRSDEAQQRQLRALAPRAKITFLGYMKAADFYDQVDVVAVPSIWEEPGALVLVEARAAGRPVLTTRFGGNPECIKDGVTGWLSKAEPSELAKRIQEIAADPQRVRTAARYAAAIGRERTFDDVVSDYRELFQRVQASSTINA